MKRIDLVGQRFDRIVITKQVGKNKWGNLLFEYKCDCGKIRITPSGSLRDGRVRSCGCYRREIGHTKNLTHGLADTRLYNIYMTMNSRCKNINNPKYHRYGGRGIKNTWDTFEAFHKDMNKSYQVHVKEFGEKETTIDRIDNDGNYCRSNCRWATLKEQARNNTGKFRKGLVPWNKKTSLDKTTNSMVG